MDTFEPDQSFVFESGDKIIVSINAPRFKQSDFRIYPLKEDIYLKISQYVYNTTEFVLEAITGYLEASEFIDIYYFRTAHGDYILLIK